MKTKHLLPTEWLETCLFFVNRWEENQMHISISQTWFALLLEMLTINPVWSNWLFWTCPDMFLVPVPSGRDKHHVFLCFTQLSWTCLASKSCVCLSQLVEGVATSVNTVPELQPCTSVPPGLFFWKSDSQQLLLLMSLTQMFTIFHRMFLHRWVESYWQNWHECLCAPATSAPPKQVFPAAGLIMTFRLTPNCVKSLFF